MKHLVEKVRQGSVSERETALTELFELAERDQAAEVFERLTGLCQKGKLTSADLLSHAPRVVGIWSKLYQQTMLLQGDPFKVRWQVDEAYQTTRLPLEWLLDLMGYVPGESVASALRESLQLADPLLKLFAVLSLLRRLEQINESDLEPIAANHQTRHKLWTQLKVLHMEFLMPQQWSAPEMLAASEFVNWAAHPMELGVPPEEIELAETFSEIVKEKRRDIYLFRFRGCPEPGDDTTNWMAGIAGPYRDGESLLSPWSSFTDWEKMSPQEHFTKLFAVVGGS